MKKRYSFYCFSFLLLAFCFNTHSSLAQVDSTDTFPVVPKKQKIAVFAPLYLDSAFDARNEYRYAKNVFPKFINPGLEFYEGVQLALDSLARQGKELEVFVYDTRSSKESLEQQLNKPEIDEVDLIIANCAGNEVFTFAEAGRQKKIPVINTTIPSEGGATANPFFVVLNPTLRTQCEAIYKYAQKYYSINPIIFFRKKGVMEDMIKNYFDDYSKVTMSVPLKIKYVDLTDSFTVNQLIPHLDELRRSFCIAGSLDPNFGKRLAFQLASIYANYPSTVMGMPTWDGIRDFNKPEFKGPEIIYGTPFYNPRTDKMSAGILDYFNTVMYARPTDMVFRGYAVTWKFANLLLQYKDDFNSSLGSRLYPTFLDFDIQPVLNRSSMTLDYFENKKVFFVKWLDGVIKGVD